MGWFEISVRKCIDLSWFPLSLSVSRSRLEKFQRSRLECRIIYHARKVANRKMQENTFVELQNVLFPFCQLNSHHESSTDHETSIKFKTDCFLDSIYQFCRNTLRMWIAIFVLSLALCGISKKPVNRALVARTWGIDMIMIEIEWYDWTNILESKIVSDSVGGTA